LGYFPTIFGVLVLIGIAVFFWRREGPDSGRAYGNRIAAHIGIPKRVFWPLLENGVKGSSRELLASLLGLAFMPALRLTSHFQAASKPNTACHC